MNILDEMDAFLNEGLTRYVPARAAVDAFERELSERLGGVFRGKQDWKNFRPKIGGSGREKATSRGVDARARAVWCAQFHEETSQGSIDLGVWWNPQQERDAVVLYASRWAPGWRLIAVELKHPQRGVRCGPLGPTARAADKRLYMPLLTLADVEKHGQQLLDELDGALASVPRIPVESSPPL